MSTTDPIYGELYDHGGATHNLRHPAIGAGGGTSDDSATIQAADDDSTVHTLHFTPGTYLIQSALTLDKAVRIENGALLQVSAALTFNGPVEAGDFHWIDVVSGGSVTGLNVADARWFGCEGNFDVEGMRDLLPTYDPNIGTGGADGADDTVPLQAALDACRILRLGGRHYRVTDTLDVRDRAIESGGGSINMYPPPSTNQLALNTPIIEASTGTHSFSGGSDLDVDVERSSDEIVSAGLVAAGVRRGDYVFMASNELVLTHTASEATHGEIGRVKRVDGNVIYLQEPTRWSYVTVDSIKPKVQVLPTCRFDTVDRLTLRHWPADDGGPPSMQLRGAHFRGVVDSTWDIECDNIGGYAVYIRNCYGCEGVLRSYNTYNSEDDGATLHVSEATTRCRFRIAGYATRHAVAMGSGDPGIPWDITITGDFSAGAGAAVLDSHGQAGRVRWENCTVRCGLVHDPETGNPVRQAGIMSGALYNEIVGCSIIGASSAVTMRGNNHALQLVVQDLTVTGCERALNLAEESHARLEELIVDGIHGTLDESQSGPAAVRIAGSGMRIGAWQFSNIHIAGGMLLVLGGTGDLPSTLRMSNCSARLDTPATNRDIVRIIGGLNGRPVARLILDNVDGSGGERFLFVGNVSPEPNDIVSLELIEMTGCNPENSLHEHIRLAPGVEVDGLRVRGGTWGALRGAGSRLITLQSGVKQQVETISSLGWLDFDPADVTVAPTGSSCRIVTGSGPDTVGWVRIGGNTPPVTGVHALLAAAPLELIAGSFRFPRCVRGTGTPAFAAEVGTTYFDASGMSGTIMYLKTSGSGTTGWTAIH